MKELIYIADSDNFTRKTLYTFVTQEGYGAISFENGDRLFDLFTKTQCDIVILDATMPGGNGFEITEKIRKVSNVPIIMLTACDTDEDYVRAISYGVDVCMAKPFRPLRLLIHIQTLLSKAKENNVIKQYVLKYADLTIYHYSLTAYCNEKELSLTKTEHSLLLYLAKNQETSVSRAELLRKIWNYSSVVETRAIDDTVKRLRKKLISANSNVIIETVWGYGFKLQVKQE